MQGRWYFTKPEMTNKQAPNYLGFLRKIALNEYMLRFWLNVPEFYEECMLLKEQGKQIDNEVVLSIMVRIYREKKKLYEQGKLQEFFGFTRALRAIKFLSKKTYGSNDSWKYL